MAAAVVVAGTWRVRVAASASSVVKKRWRIGVPTRRPSPAGRSVLRKHAIFAGVFRSQQREATLPKHPALNDPELLRRTEIYIKKINIVKCMKN
jgi:hypothetical protein